MVNRRKTKRLLLSDHTFLQELEMANTVFAEEIRNLTEELGEQDLEKLARGIEQVKLARFSSDTYKKGMFARILSDTDIISSDLDFTRLTRPDEPFSKGTVHIIGVTIPYYCVNGRYDMWSRQVFHDPYYPISYYSSKKQKVVPLLVIDNLEIVHLENDDKIKICDEIFKVNLYSIHKCEVLNEESIWSKKGKVDYSQTDVKKVVDKWFKKLVEKNDAMKAAGTAN